MTITLSETKIYLRVDYNDVESLIRSLIDSAIDICTDASGNKTTWGSPHCRA